MNELRDLLVKALNLLGRDTSSDKTYVPTDFEVAILTSLSGAGGEWVRPGNMVDAVSYILGERIAGGFVSVKPVSAQAIGLACKEMTGKLIELNGIGVVRVIRRLNGNTKNWESQLVEVAEDVGA